MGEFGNTNTYRENLQRDYGEVSYSEASAVIDLPPEKFAEEMMACFQSAGILDAIKERRISILASSVSRGDKDWAFLRKLDHAIDALETPHRPEVLLTDFALKSKGGVSVIEKSKYAYKNLDINIVASDSEFLPFRGSSITVLYERLGALFHAAEHDVLANNGGMLTRKFLEEYKRVLEPGGKIIFDSINNRAKISTLKNVNKIIQDDDTNKFFTDMGFKVETSGQKEGFVILTCPEEKNSEPQKIK